MTGSESVRLPYRHIREFRQQTLLLQNCQCALCEEPITDDAVLDHCHRTGLVRRVLHRGCNALLGKIENNLKRNRITTTRLERIASNLTDYILTEHTDIIHPRHQGAIMKKSKRKPAKKKY